MMEDEREYNEKLGLRIAAARGALSQVEFAEALEISKNTMLRYEKGYSVPDIVTIRKICDLTRVCLDWLANGEGPMRVGDSVEIMPVSEAFMVPGNSSDPQPCAVSDSGAISIPQWKNPDPEAFDYIPMADAKLSAGGGCFVISERIEGYYAFRKSWLSRVATGVKNLVLMRVHGGSMDPTIQDADTVMIDTGRRDIREGMIYALRVDSTIMIKRLSFRTGGKVLVISDNRQEYEPYEAAIKDLFIIGQIIFFSRTFVPD